MKREIEESIEITHPSLHIIKDFFNSGNFSLQNINDSEKNRVFNFCIFKKNDLNRYKNENYCDLAKTVIANHLTNEIINEIYNFVNYLKSIYDLDIIWLMLYESKSHLDFHIDTQNNRHIISALDDDRFFNYECSNPSTEDMSLYSEKLKLLSNDIDMFNDYFIKQNTKYNKIKILKSNKVYTFNQSIHNFYNDSKKIRVNFVFEINEG